MTISKPIACLAAAVGLFLLTPMLIIVPMSFSSARTFEFPPPGYTLGYYKIYFTSAQWLVPTYNSLLIALGAAVVSVLVALPAAYAYVRMRLPGRDGMNLLLILPMIVPQVITALAFYLLLSRMGIAGTKFGVILAHACLCIPVTFLAISAAFKGLDVNLERAAMSLGAGPLQTFFLVTLPIIKPGVAVGTLFAFVQSFNEPVIALFIAGRDATTLPKKMFESVRMETDPVIAVVSTIVTAVAVLGVALVLGMRKR